MTLLHQHQRPVKTVEHQGRQVEFIEVALEDIEIANRLANEVLGRAVDDLPPQTRRLLGLINEMVTVVCQRRGLARADYRFSRRDVREQTGWGLTQLQIHLRRLEELEYLLVHRGGRGQSFVYELLYEARRRRGRALPGPVAGRGAVTTQPAGFERQPAGVKPASNRGQIGAKPALAQWRKPCQLPNRTSIFSESERQRTWGVTKNSAVITRHGDREEEPVNEP